MRTQLTEFVGESCACRYYREHERRTEHAQLVSANRCVLAAVHTVAQVTDTIGASYYVYTVYSRSQIYKHPNTQ